MANVRNSNTWYIDGTATNLAVKNIKIVKLLVTATAASADLVLQDIDTTDNKLSVSLSADSTSELFDFSESPIVFPNGIKPSTVTNCVATAIIRESQS